MKFLRGKSLKCRLNVIVLICLLASAFPGISHYVGLSNAVNALENEKNGVMILQNLAAIVDGSFAASVSAKDMVSRENEINTALQRIVPLIEKMESNTSFKDADRGVSSFDIGQLKAFPSLQDKHNALPEIAMYVMTRSGLYTDSAYDTAVLANSAGGNFPSVYSGFFALLKLFDDWSDRMDSSNSAALISRSAVIDDDCKDLSSMLRHAYGSGNADASATMGALSRFNMASTELNTVLVRAWRDKVFSVEQVENVLADTARITSDLWIYTNSNLLESVDRRIEKARIERPAFCLKYAAFAAVCLGFSLLLSWRLVKASENTLELAKAADEDAAKVDEVFDSIRTQCSTFSDINGRILSFARNAASVRSAARAVAASAAKLNYETESFVQKQKSRLENLSKNFARILSKSESEAVFDKNVSDNIVHLRECLNLAQQSAISHSKDAFDAAVSLGSAVDSYGEISKSYDFARETAEKMTIVSEAFTSLAEQANITSLNLSIEIAKAGLKGTGLNTIAEQIRIMSKRTVVSVLDIDAIREVVVKSLGEGMNAAGDFYVMLRANAGVVRDLHESLEKLSKSIDDISDTASNIASALREHTSYDAQAEESLKAVSELEFSLTNLHSVVKNSAAAIQKLEGRIGG